MLPLVNSAVFLVSSPDEIIGDPECDPLLLLDGGVRHGVGQLSQRLEPPQGLGQDDHLKEGNL